MFALRGKMNGLPSSPPTPHRVLIPCNNAHCSPSYRMDARLPEFPEPGMAWLEVQSHAGSSCPIISDGFPLLFTWKELLAEELSSCLLDRLPTIQHVASFLEVRLWVGTSLMCAGLQSAESRISRLFAIGSHSSVIL